MEELTKARRHCLQSMCMYLMYTPTYHDTHGTKACAHFIHICKDVQMYILVVSDNPRVIRGVPSILRDG